MRRNHRELRQTHSRQAPFIPEFKGHGGTTAGHVVHTCSGLASRRRIIRRRKLKERVISGVYCIEALSRIPSDCVFLLFLSPDDARLISPTPAVPNLQLPDTRHYTPQPPPSHLAISLCSQFLPIKKKKRNHTAPTHPPTLPSPARNKTHSPPPPYQRQQNNS